MGLLHEVANAIDQGALDLSAASPLRNPSSLTRLPSGSASDPTNAAITILTRVLNAFQAWGNSQSTEANAGIMKSQASAKYRSAEANAEVAIMLGIISGMSQLLSMVDAASSSQGQTLSGGRSSVDLNWLLEMAKRLQAVVTGKIVPRSESILSESTLAEWLRQLRVQQQKMRSQSLPRRLDPRRLPVLLPLFEQIQQILKRLQLSPKPPGGFDMAAYSRLLGSLDRTKSTLRQKLSL